LHHGPTAARDAIAQRWASHVWEERADPVDRRASRYLGDFFLPDARLARPVAAVGRARAVCVMDHEILAPTAAA